MENDVFSIEDVRRGAKRAKILNTVLIVVTLLYYGSILAFNSDLFGLSDPVTFFFLLRGISVLAAVIILIFTIMTIGKMKFLNIEGWVQLLASSILFLVFAFFGFVLGLVILIISGISIRKIRESVEILEIENGGINV